MSIQQQGFTRVASLPEVVEGKPKAVRVKGHSVALFNVGGRIYATDNQCPHMGYPLTRGAIRDGVLTCDWHGWSFDLEGGGCFVGGCDDLATFPVDIRDGEIWLDLNKAESSRRENRLQLLQEGLLTEDSWTLSKAIALLLADGLPEKDVIELFVKHMGRHIATHRGPEGGRNVSHLINGIKVARRYDADDRLIPADAGRQRRLRPGRRQAAGRAAAAARELGEDRELGAGVFARAVCRRDREMSRDRAGVSAATTTGFFRCSTSARWSLTSSVSSTICCSCATSLELVEELGWDQSSELVCNLSAKLLGRGRPAPERFQLEAMKIYEPIEAAMKDGRTSREAGGGQPTTRRTRSSRRWAAATRLDLPGTVGMCSAREWTSDRVITTMVLVAADRMARTAVNLNPGWGALTAELNLAASLRTAKRYGGPLVTRKALYHAGYRHFEDRWLNITTRPLTPADASARQDTRQSRMKRPGLRRSRTASSRCA